MSRVVRGERVRGAAERHECERDTNKALTDSSWSGKNKTIRILLEQPKQPERKIR